MKKLATILLSIITIASFSACGGSNPAPEDNQNSTQEAANSTKEEPVEISFMTVGDPYVGAIKTLLPEFEEQYNIKVTLDSVPYLNLHEKAIIELAGNTGSYDLISVDAPWIGEFVEGGHLLEITDLVERDKDELMVEDFLPGAWEGLALWKGKTMGLPLAPYYMYLHYRTDKFEEKGITVPGTYEEFDQSIQALYDKDQNFFGLSVAMKRGPSIVNDWMAYYNGFGGKTFVDEGSNFRTDINTEIGIMTTELFKNAVAYSPPGVLQYENIDRWNDFMHGNSAMVAVYNANSPMFESAEDSKVAGKVAYALLPKLNNDSKASMPFAGFSIAINADSKKTEAAWTFMKWMTSQEVDKKWVQVDGDAGVPRRLSTVKDQALLDKYEYFQLILEAEEGGMADGVDFRARVPEWTKIEEILGLQLNLAVSGEKPVKEALDEAADQINQLMIERGYPVN